VGFRPFIYRLATGLGLCGWVCNTSEDVTIEVEGAQDKVEAFCSRLREEAPPLAQIETVGTTHHPPTGYGGFEIRESLAAEGQYQLVSPDIATCQACLQELSDPHDRRYRYPFTNCTNCGPRFTIIEDMPYDRPKTTMRSFHMCSRCQAEYDDPADRRFHAQPNACPECGPKVELVDSKGRPCDYDDAIATAAELLRGGRILAVKGLGGFLLACDATNEAAVGELRLRKRRSSKPFALMVRGVEEAAEHCHVSTEERSLLLSTQCPIVLMRRKDDSSICPEVAPCLKHLGLMLPYTPLHHLLLRDAGLPLVMTSGNLSEEPIARDNEEALQRLSGLADYFLIHDRDIRCRYDDSVAFVEQGQPRLVRRARGYAPYPIKLPFEVRPVLGCGADTKNAFCLTRDDHAFLSQHIGDMENLETLEHFTDTIDLYERLFRVEPELIAHDLHPDFLATRYARERAATTAAEPVAVQHHHAHIVSCMVDNGVRSPVIGIAFDGTGLGTDGRTWGSEFLLAEYGHFERVAHLEYLPLPGGDASVPRPYRIALAYLLTLLGEEALDPPLPFMRQVPRAEIDVLRHQVVTGFNSPLTSSMGRLFDAVSAMIGVRQEINYEGQAAIELEALAYRAGHLDGPCEYPYAVEEHERQRIIRLRETLDAVRQDVLHGVPAPVISLRFHQTVARMVERLCVSISNQTGISNVALTGGVFQNRQLLHMVAGPLDARGMQVLTHRQAPCNDGGIALGQAVIAHCLS
jgi:hydrogenase maturation protein HypF